MRFLDKTSIFFYGLISLVAFVTSGVLIVGYLKKGNDDYLWGAALGIITSAVFIYSIVSYKNSCDDKKE